MKKLLALLLFPAAALAQAPQAFTLKGHMALGKPLDWVYINYRNEYAVVKDSIRPINGKFTYKGKITEPTLASIRVSYSDAGGDDQRKAETLQLFLEPGTTRIRIKDTITAQKVKGNAAHKDYQALVAGQKPFRDQIKQLYDKYVQASKENNTEEMKQIIEQREKLDEEMLATVNLPFLQKNLNSPVALFALTQIAGYDIDADKADPLFALLSPKVKALPSAMEFKEQIETAKRTGIGRHAMDFTQNDTLGKPVSLSSFKGQYVLVDFWASWCGPCRAENPNVVKVFNAYKDKGFTVLGVSLDRPNAKDKWLKAIHDDNLTWTHVSDLKFWDNEVARLYGIRAIPQNLLIDPDGRIVAKNIRGEALGQAVEKAISEAAF